MKRILFACFLLVTFCAQHVNAQAVVHVSASDFATEVNLLDSYIGAGNMTAANTTWDSVNHMIIHVLSYTKKSIHVAATPAEKASYNTILSNQRSIYLSVWPLHTDLTANRTALHTQLMAFDATIY